MPFPTHRHCGFHSFSFGPSTAFVRRLLRPLLTSRSGLSPSPTPHARSRSGRGCAAERLALDKLSNPLDFREGLGFSVGTVDPDFETELKTDLRLLPRENPCAEQDG